MTEPSNSDDETDDIYANSVIFFMRELKVLSETADKQCAIKQYDNVAWEIKHFFMRTAKILLHLPHESLDEINIKAINQLLLDVESVPTWVVNVENSRDYHLKAMADPCWVPIRSHASKLLSDLNLQKRATNAVLGINEHTA